MDFMKCINFNHWQLNVLKQAKTDQEQSLKGSEEQN